jgi:hypothetical protein
MILCFQSYVAQTRSMPIALREPLVEPNRLARAVATDRFKRAKGRCERCRRPHWREVVYIGDSTGWDEQNRRWRDGRGRRARGLLLLQLLEAQQLFLDGSARCLGCPSPVSYSRIATSRITQPQ